MRILEYAQVPQSRQMKSEQAGRGRKGDLSSNRHDGRDADEHPRGNRRSKRGGLFLSPKRLSTSGPLLTVFLCQRANIFFRKFDPVLLHELGLDFDELFESDIRAKDAKYPVLLVPHRG